MHGYLLMYCVYNTLCISLNWWIHLHPLENKNSLKGQSHISLAVAEASTDSFFLFCWEMKSEKERRKRQTKKKEGPQQVVFLKFIFWETFLLRLKKNYDERLFAKWNFQSMQINLLFAKSCIWDALYVEHLTRCFSSYFSSCLLNCLLRCPAMLHLED